jgi:hypothetical protein
MGIIRKMTSASTLGLVDFRSDKERIARSTRQTSKQAAEQTKLLQKQVEIQQQAALQANANAAISRPAATAPVAGPPAGWMLDPQGSGRQRWWDGSAWTEHYQA